MARQSVTTVTWTCEYCHMSTTSDDFPVGWIMLLGAATHVGDSPRLVLTGARDVVTNVDVVGLVQDHTNLPAGRHRSAPDFCSPMCVANYLAQGAGVPTLPAPPPEIPPELIPPDGQRHMLYGPERWDEHGLAMQTTHHGVDYTIRYGAWCVRASCGFTRSLDATSPRSDKSRVELVPDTEPQTCLLCTNNTDSTEPS